MAFDEYKVKEDKVRTGLENESEKKAKNKCVKKVLEFYENNKTKCEDALEKYYSVRNNRRMYVTAPETLNGTNFRKKISSTNKRNMLILTANDIENKLLVWNLSQSVNSCLNSYVLDDLDHHPCININFCSIGEYNIIHHHAQKTGDEYTRRAINDITHFFKPDFIVLLGICYGLDMESQKIGLVNISEEITGVRINFRDMPDSDEIIFEPEIEFEKTPNSTMTTTITRLLSNMDVYEYNSHDTVDHMYGKIISANSLMSCKIVKDAIMGKLRNNVRGERELIGGEMEACGIFKSNLVEDNGFEFDRWIVIKSICDWGESKNSLVADKDANSHIKDSLQAYAMMNSCKLFVFLTNNTAFR